MTSRKAKTLDLILQLIKKNYWKEVKTRAEIKDLKILLKWRRERDSNPRNGFPFTRFPSVRLQPLGHLSFR